jgi:TadE-like protein
VTLRALPSLGRSQNGATLVEFALVSPVFLAPLFGTLEFGRALWTQQALQQTAIAGARCMALPQTNCATAAYLQLGKYGNLYPRGREPVGDFASEREHHPKQRCQLGRRQWLLPS